MLRGGVLRGGGEPPATCEIEIGRLFGLIQFTHSVRKNP